MAVEVTQISELVAAVDDGATEIVVSGVVVAPGPVVLPPGTTIRGATPGESGLGFATGGLGLRRDCVVRDLTIVSPTTDRAVFLAPGDSELGTIELSGLRVTGQVGLIARTEVLSGHFEVRDVHVGAADARAWPEQPQKYGVNVVQGAFSIINMNGSPDSRLTATVDGVGAGHPRSPVLGSGVVVGGFGDTGGRLEVDRLVTTSVHSTGLLPWGTADLITGAVFVLYGCRVDDLRNDGPCATYGVNDMVLDNWGDVGTWTAVDEITSFGPSAIGFVNFGTVDTFDACGPIRTHGLGSRGFNQYDGTVHTARFASIETTADGAVGIQISRPVGTIEVAGDITTAGGIGPSLVKGVILSLPAIAFSVKPGGEVQELTVGGSIATAGDGVTAYAVDTGTVHAVSVGGGLRASGAGSETFVLENGGTSPEP